MKAPDIRLILIEDHAVLSAEIGKWIDATSGLQCLGIYSSGEDALTNFPSPAPDVALVDLRLPGMSGVELIRSLRQRHPAVQCLVLTMYAESELIFEALKAGACGYLLKRTPLPEIADAIRKVHAGGSVMTPRIARRVLEMFAGPSVFPDMPAAGSPGPDSGPAGTGPSAESKVAAGSPETGTGSGTGTSPATGSLPSLTEREIRVLQSLVQGRARKQITGDLEINTHTLDYVIRCIYRKLHVQSLAGAVSLAVRQGLVRNS